MIMLDRLSDINLDATASYVAARQNEDGSFGGDEYGEVDTRFTFCAIAALFLIVSI